MPEIQAVRLKRGVEIKLVTVNLLDNFPKVAQGWPKQETQLFWLFLQLLTTASSLPRLPGSVCDMLFASCLPPPSCLPPTSFLSAVNFQARATFGTHCLHPSILAIHLYHLLVCLLYSSLPRSPPGAPALLLQAAILFTRRAWDAGAGSWEKDRWPVLSQMPP